MTLMPVPDTLLGGALIGAATSLLYLGIGRIAGISGITFGLIGNSDRAWRAVFLAGLIGGGLLAAYGMGFGTPNSVDTPVWLLVIAGALVGFGTRIGNGCTSGHGVCGLARLSPRSAAAVAIFMLFGVASATLLRPLLT